jgi:TPR repeat protein
MGWKILGDGRYRIYKITDSVRQVKMTLLFTIHCLSRRLSTLLVMFMASILLFGGQARAEEEIEIAVAALDAGRYQVAQEGFEMLANRGNTDAQTLLGIMYSEGMGVRLDIQQARYWLSRAAHQGGHSAQFLLGLSYLGGYGNVEGNARKTDPAKARIWLRRAAHNGNPLAQRFLVRAYRHGWFGSENQQHASYWQERLQDVN